MKPLHWRLIGVAGAFLVLIAAWFLLISPQLSKAEALQAETLSQQQAADQLRSKISLLKKQSQELPAKEAELAAIAQRMPGTPSVPSLIREVNKVAAKAGVNMTSITPGAPAAIKVQAAEEPVKTASPTAGSETTVEESAVPRANAAATAQVMSIPLTISACGSYQQIHRLMKGLEEMQRAVLVTSLALSKGACGKSADTADAVIAAVGAQAFMLPKSTPASASPEPTATRSGS